jgi:hypothetical protein
LAVWLDAADAGTITRDDAGRVSLWRNKSERGCDATQKQPQFRPGYDPAGLNGKPVLRFDEKSATRLELPDLADGRISATIFVVLANPAPGDPKNHDARLFTTSDGQGLDYQVGLCASVPGMTTGGPRQMMVTFTDRWAKQTRVGCFSPHPQTYFTGHIAEILVYRRILTPAEQGRVRAYLVVKWDLSH